jgi:phage gp46-like protein
MADLKLNYYPPSKTEPGYFDLQLESGSLVLDDTLKTAVLLSLFSNARAAIDEPLPYGNEGSRQGWWATPYTDFSGEYGSKLWLLAREKQIPTVLVRAKAYAEESLKWLLDEGIAERVGVVAEFVRTGFLGIEVQIYRPLQPVVKYNYAWDALANAS